VAFGSTILAIVIDDCIFTAIINAPPLGDRTGRPESKGGGPVQINDPSTYEANTPHRARFRKLTPPNIYYSITLIHPQKNVFPENVFGVNTRNQCQSLASAFLWVSLSNHIAHDYKRLYFGEI